MNPATQRRLSAGRSPSVVTSKSTPPSPIDGVALLGGRPTAAYPLLKRVFDFSGAAIALTLLSPVLAICALWIKLVDGGPVIYRQWRTGRNGWLFVIYKFRTMRLDAEKQGARFASADDARIIPGCGWMRRSHVDELPQLFNILKGEMSLVGPRPERPEMIERLRPEIPDFDARLDATPGLTGLAQVASGYSNDTEGMRHKLRYDLAYLRRRSLLADVHVVVKTVPKFWDHTAC
jgi:lipopolysaccharide/colanic/teichoic acid biosynthesis glycosyltransferase